MGVRSMLISEWSDMSQHVRQSDWEKTLATFRELFPGEFAYSSHPTPTSSKYVFQKCQFASAHAAMEYMHCRMVELEFGPETQELTSDPGLVAE